MKFSWGVIAAAILGYASSVARSENTSNSMGVNIGDIGVDPFDTPALPENLSAPNQLLETTLLVEVISQGQQAKVVIPADLQDLASKILPSTIMTETTRRRLAADGSITTDRTTAELIKQHFDNFQQYRAEMASVPSVDLSDPATTAQTLFRVRVPESASDDDTRRRLAELDIESLIRSSTTSTGRKLLRSEPEYEEAAVIINHVDELPILQQKQYCIDVTALNPEERGVKLQQLLDAGLIVLADGQLTVATDNLDEIPDVKDDTTAAQQEQMLHEYARELANSDRDLAATLDNCLFIFDSCSLTMEEWARVGIPPSQIKYAEAICTPGYNKHGSASMYAAWKNDPDAQLFFLSVFGPRGESSLGILDAAYERAKQILIQRQLVGECRGYAGFSFSGYGGLVPSLVQSSAAVYQSLSNAVVFAASGNNGFGGFENKISVCNEGHIPNVRRYLGRQANKPTTLGIVSAFMPAVTEALQQTKVRPVYANLDEPGAGGCVDIIVQTDVEMAPGVYSSPIYGGTSGSTASANGFASRLARVLKSRGLNYQPARIAELIRGLPSEFTKPGVSNFPMTYSGWTSEAFAAPGYPVLDAESIANLVARLVTSPNIPVATLAPTKFDVRPTPPTKRPTKQPTRATKAPSTAKSPTTQQTTNYPTRRPTGAPTATAEGTVVYRIKPSDVGAVIDDVKFTLKNEVNQYTKFKFKPDANVKIKGGTKLMSTELYLSNGVALGTISLARAANNRGNIIRVSGFNSDDIILDRAVANKIVVTRNVQTNLRWKKSESKWLLQVQVNNIPETWNTLATVNNPNVKQISVGAGVAGNYEFVDTKVSSKLDNFGFYKQLASELQVKPAGEYRTAAQRRQLEVEFRNAHAGIDTELANVGVMQELSDTRADGLGGILNRFKSNPSKTAEEQSMFEKINSAFAGPDPDKRNFLTLILALRKYGLDARGEFNDKFKELIVDLAERSHDGLATMLINLIDTGIQEQIKKLPDQASTNNLIRKIWMLSLQVNRPDWNPAEDLSQNYPHTSSPTSGNSPADPNTDSPPAAASGTDAQTAIALSVLATMVVAGAAIYKRQTIGDRVTVKVAKLYNMLRKKQAATTQFKSSEAVVANPENADHPAPITFTNPVMARELMGLKTPGNPEKPSHKPPKNA